MSSLMDLITSQLSGSTLSQMSNELGKDEQATSGAIAAALPVLITALQRNASSPQGAQSLDHALRQDHDGSIFNHLESALRQPNPGNGDGILRHVLGKKRPVVEKSLSRSTQLQQSEMSKLLTMLAPILMGALGKQKQERNLEARDLPDVLGRQTQEIEQTKPGAGSLIGSLLDQDGDGDFDLGDVAKGMFGKLFR